VFKHDPGLTYNLLRLVNSVGMGMQQKITSRRHAIVVLGRSQLQRWLQRLLFAHHGEGNLHDPLLQLAATRGKLMELLARHIAPHDRELEDQAFMAGIMSLLDTLLAMKMEDVMGQLSLPEKVKAAVLRREGVLGDMLRMGEMLEHNDYDAAIGILPKYPSLRLSELTRSQIEALSWACNLGVSEEMA